MRMNTRTQTRYFLALLLLLAVSGAARAQTTAFAYQGKLTDGGAPANGSYDLQFTLWDAAQGGNQQPQAAPVTITKPGVAVRNGAFSVQLDFGVSAFPGADRFLEIGVRPAGGANFTTLAPRQQISASPYAIHTISATAADSLSAACVGCVQDAQIGSVSAGKLTGAIPAASLPDLGASYVKNSTAPQANADFNVSGSGTVGSLNVNGAVSVGPAAAPAPAPAGQGRIYFDTAAHKFRVSESGGSFVDLVGGTLSQSNGNVGIGTTTPATKLDVRGHLTLDPGSSPVLYTSSAAGEQNRYLQLINSPSTPSASGLMAGGLLVADSYGYAAPGKNDLVVKGNAGFGTPSPASKLHIAGSANILSPFRGLTIDQSVQPGQNTSGYALKVTTTSSGVTGTNLLIDSVGNVGVGTGAPQNRLDVGGGAAFGGYAGVNAAPANGLIVSGNVGVGTASPTTAKLVVNDTSVGTAVAGVAAFGSGVFGQSASSTGWGVYGRNRAGGFAMFADGNAGQAPDKGGFVKAMAYIHPNDRVAPTIVRCYNGVTGESSNGCGFGAVGTAGEASITVVFDFLVSGRFVVMTPVGFGRPDLETVKSYIASIVGNTVTVVNIETCGTNCGSGQMDFMIVVF